MSRNLKIAAAALIALTVMGGLLYRSAPVQDILMRSGVAMMLNSGPEAIDGLQVVVCGSASPLGNNPDRAQACLAVVTPEHFFLVDVGARSPMRIAQAQLPMNRLTGVMLTHFHSDHIAGLADVNLASWCSVNKSEGIPAVLTAVAGSLERRATVIPESPKMVFSGESRLEDGDLQLLFGREEAGEGSS